METANLSQQSQNLEKSDNNGFFNFGDILEARKKNGQGLRMAQIGRAHV